MNVPVDAAASDPLPHEHTQADICVAVATPPGQSGLALIRMSGPGAADLVDPLFVSGAQRFPRVRKMAGYSCATGYLIDPNDEAVLDQVVLTRFTAPHSYTGEDTIEISCHGGSAVKQIILELLIRHGARPAQPGEFTRRAFLNGKMDLTQAEAVMDLISADAARSVRNAAAQLRGQLSDLIRQDVQALYNLLAGVELMLEYPEHEADEQVDDQLPVSLGCVAERLEKRIDGYAQGRLLRERLTVVLAGSPNTGKSSLLNALAGYERAIVTPVPGTTRDTVEENIVIQGIPIRLIDTAGLRDTRDPVEQIGVNRARQAMQQADLVFWLVSSPTELPLNELEKMRQSDCRNLVPLVSKDDLAANVSLRDKLKEMWPDQTVMTCSALTGDGLTKIKDKIVSVYETRGLAQQEDVLITNNRHRICLEKAASSLREAETGLQQGLTLDIIALLLRRALEALAELTGDHVTDKLVDTIFSRFCIGK